MEKVGVKLILLCRKSNKKKIVIIDPKALPPRKKNFLGEIEHTIGCLKSKYQTVTYFEFLSQFVCQFGT